MKKTEYLAIAAVSLDGRIGAHEKHFSDWTSKEDKKFMRALLEKCDAIVVGNSTYKTAIVPLSKRNCIVLTRSVKTQKRISPNLLYVNPKSVNLKRLVESATIYSSAWEKRKGSGRRIAILGGAQTYAYCLEHKMLTDLYLTIEPVIFGAGIPLFAGKYKLRKTKVVSVKKLNRKGTVLIHAKVGD
jgi:dihydrofolate reductase